MKKNKFFVPLVTFGMLLAAVTGCGVNNNNALSSSQEGDLSGSSDSGEEQFQGYGVTFALQHCSVLVYESGQDYSVDPVAPEQNKTKARNE